MTAIDSQMANHVLWYFTTTWGLPTEGYEPGSFTLALIAAIVRADPTNRARLAAGFPGYVHAVTLVDRHDRIDLLRSKAGERVTET